jgi:hypothetical protein
LADKKIYRHETQFGTYTRVEYTTEVGQDEDIVDILSALKDIVSDSEKIYEGHFSVVLGYKHSGLTEEEEAEQAAQYWSTKFNSFEGSFERAEDAGEAIDSNEFGRRYKNSRVTEVTVMIAYQS